MGGRACHYTTYLIVMYVLAFFVLVSQVLVLVESSRKPQSPQVGMQYTMIAASSSSSSTMSSSSHISTIFHEDQNTKVCGLQSIQNGPTGLFHAIILVEITLTMKILNLSHGRVLCTATIPCRRKCVWRES